MRLGLYIFLMFIFSSCVLFKGTKKTVVNYIQDARDTNITKTITIAEPVIQINDLLSIQISSASLDPSADALYNINALQGGAGVQQQIAYLVDAEGDVELPRLGKIHAVGLSKNELAKTIKNKLNGLLTQPTVLIRFTNFRVTVLGEVKNPTVLTIPTEHLTILEALGMTGGITDYGTIKQVRVLRENNGKRETGLLDLTSQAVFQSPFYQLQQNDVVLVDQTTYKISEEERSRKTQALTITLTVISSLAVIYTLFFKK